ncbi:hypothetical protein [Pseudomonas sp. BGI-2]|uniref:hypothetical protein n=1 Tax=Pseudomonas sp. BGI-2 TaxID=2528211 RepID=UPI0021155BD4|nr:hypothetical protein [Pseudomonas sp. BGI-2]
MDPLDIEDNSDWLRCPTELETCRYFLRITENEVQELTLQLRKAREDIFGLVQMHAKADLADSNRRSTDTETKSNWELMANNKHIAELTVELRALEGSKP